MRRTRAIAARPRGPTAPQAPLGRHRRRLAFACVLTAGATLFGGIDVPASANVNTGLLERYTPPDGELDPVMLALRDGTIETNVPPLDPGQIAPEPVDNGYLVAGAQLDGLEVTNTAIGQLEIAVFTKQLRDQGEFVQAGGYRVFSLPGLNDFDPRDYTPDTSTIDGLTEDEGTLGSPLVIPACAGLPELVGAVKVAHTSSYAAEHGRVNGSEPGVYFKTMFSSAAGRGCDRPDLVPEVGQIDALDQPDPGKSDEWTPAGGLGCVKRSNNTAWYLPCSWWHHRTNDGNANRDTFGLVQYGTAKSKGIWTLAKFEVQSWRKEGTADQDWVDWGPRADSDYGSCSTDTAGVQVNGAYLEHSTTHCEEWDIDLKPGEPGGFANRWKGSKRRKERDTAMVIATNVPNGQVPTDYVDFDYYAW